MPRYNQPGKTWRYTNEFKVTAVQLSHLEGVRVNQVAKSLDIHPFMLSRWRKEYREGRIVADKRKKAPVNPADKKKLDKIKQLEKQVAELKQENKLLKKWQRFLAEEHHNDTSSSRETDKNSK